MPAPIPTEVFLWRVFPKREYGKWGGLKRPDRGKKHPCLREKIEHLIAEQGDEPQGDDIAGGLQEGGRSQRHTQQRAGNEKAANDISRPVMSKIEPLPNDHARQAKRNPTAPHPEPYGDIFASQEKNQGSGDEDRADHMPAGKTIAHEQRWQRAGPGAVQAGFQQFREKSPAQDNEQGVSDIRPTPLQPKHADAQATEYNQIPERRVFTLHADVDEMTRPSRLEPLVDSRIQRNGRLHAQELEKNQAAQQKGQALIRFSAQGSVWLPRVPTPHYVDDDLPSP